MSEAEELARARYPDPPDGDHSRGNHNKRAIWLEGAKWGQSHPSPEALKAWAAKLGGRGCNWAECDAFHILEVPLEQCEGPCGKGWAYAKGRENPSPEARAAILREAKRRQVDNIDGPLADELGRMTPAEAWRIGCRQGVAAKERAIEALIREEP